MKHSMLFICLTNYAHVQAFLAVLRRPLTTTTTQQPPISSPLSGIFFLFAVAFIACISCCMCCCDMCEKVSLWLIRRSIRQITWNFFFRNVTLSISSLKRSVVSYRSILITEWPQRTLSVRAWTVTRALKWLRHPRVEDTRRRMIITSTIWRLHLC